MGTGAEYEECPICMLPLPFAASENIYCVTCGKTVCVGCVLSSAKVHIKDGGDVETASAKAMTCPLCRSNTALDGDKSALKALMKRANTVNHEAMYHLGRYYFDGEMGLRQDKAEGLKWYHRAIEAGSGKAALLLGGCYSNGDGVDKDIEKALEYFQKAADLGFSPAFALIGNLLMKKGEVEEGMLNFRKAVMCGYCNDDLFNKLRNGFKYGYITKDEYAFTLRENQKACNEMKSDGREQWKRCNASR